MILLMTVNTAQFPVLFLTVGKLGVYTLMTSGTHIVGNLLPVLNIGGRVHRVAAHTAAVLLKGNVWLGVALYAVGDIAMSAMMAAAAAQVCMGTRVLSQLLPLRFVTFGTIRLKLAQPNHG